jgi:hypothetical protein
MNKTLVISIGAIIVIGLIALAFWLMGGSQSSPNNPSNGQITLPISNSTGQTTNTTPSTGTSGGTIKAKDFLNDPATVKDPINPGYYYLGYHVNEGVPDSTATDSPPYIVEYISSTQYFDIALLQEPIGTTRGEAEQYLMAHLGISETQMCQLNYTVSVPDSVNSQYAGKNLGFSFCSGATILPK